MSQSNQSEFQASPPIFPVVDPVKTRIDEPDYVEPLNYECPTCGLKSLYPVEQNKLEISYLVSDKDPYVRGYYACVNCLKACLDCVQEFMKINRINRGVSLRAMRDQETRQPCGCGG